MDQEPSKPSLSCLWGPIPHPTTGKEVYHPSSSFRTFIWCWLFSTCPTLWEWDHSQWNVLWTGGHTQATYLVTHYSLRPSGINLLCSAVCCPLMLSLSLSILSFSSVRAIPGLDSAGVWGSRLHISLNCCPSSKPYLIVNLYYIVSTHRKIIRESLVYTEYVHFAQI